MNVLLVCMLLAVALSQQVTYSEEDEAQWEIFKIEYERVYGDENEENLRKEIFMKHLEFIREHNKKYERGEVTFTVGVNQFADLTNKEFRESRNGFKVPEGYVRKGAKFDIPENLEIATTIDWRKKGAVTPIKTRANVVLVGSSVRSTGSLEGQTFLKTKKLMSLSEQYLIDCSQMEGNQGCKGGLTDYAFQYVEDNQGIDTESSYPYQGRDYKSCRYNAKNKGTTDSGYVDITSGSEEELQAAVANIGPSPWPLTQATNPSNSTIGIGVYKELCSTHDLDHAVLVVGYGTAKKGGDYWLVKNSWGYGWGVNGYIMMARNHNNMCGIATMASFPTV